LSPRETAAPAPTSAELIARARNFIPKLIECSAETDRERRVPHRVVDEMREAGLFRALQPKRWGGYETDVGTYYEIEMALAEGDMSAGWIYGVVGVTQWVMALLDDRAAQVSGARIRARWSGCRSRRPASSCRPKAASA
jgi:3-hydroxy-9,10-secoandrosta-1,3,5(10)-triene-9,17-dione monooxygenase